MATISVTNLGKAYKQYPSRWSRLAEWLIPGHKPLHHLKWVLQDINFTINPGEAVGIIGINGAGKSTLLKMITGTTQPTTGRVHITGRVAAILELGMGFHPDFTGRQNIYMAGQLLGYCAEEIERLMPEIEAFSEIDDYIDQPMRMYSSGMQARMAFAVATATRPDILIVDEALSVGDVYFQSKCYTRIAKYKKEGMTLLLVSHAAMDIVKQCNRAIFIKDGRIAIDGEAKDVVNAYMDALFGSADKSTSKDLASNDAGLKNDLSLIGLKELFHERPGYRKEEYRWGKGGAKILDYLIIKGDSEYPTSIETNSIIHIYFSVLFDEDIEFVTPGILIKTLEGLFVYGTNSHIASKGKRLIYGEKGKVSIYKFTFRVGLNEGAYLLSLGVSRGDPTQTTEPVDRRYDSIIINVTNPVHMWGLVDLQAEFEILEGKNQNVR